MNANTRQANVTAQNDRRPVAGPDPVPHTPGQTTTQVGAEPAPRLPHERDESVDSQVGAPTPVIRQAKADMESERVDTDRAGPMDEVYQREMREGTPKPPQPPRGGTRG